MTIDQLKDALKSKELPINNTDNSRAMGLTFRECTRSIYKPTKRRNPRRKPIAEVATGRYSIIYNRPMDAQGFTSHFNDQAVWDATVSTIESLGLKWKECGFGIVVTL